MPEDVNVWITFTTAFGYCDAKKKKKKLESFSLKLHNFEEV